MAAASLMHRRRVMERSIIYVGLDVHKETIAVALPRRANEEESTNAG
jgi:hypothetical protein